MTVYKFAIADALFERSPGQEGEIFTGNLLAPRRASDDRVRALRPEPGSARDHGRTRHDDCPGRKHNCLRRAWIADSGAWRDHCNADRRQGDHPFS